MLNLLVKTVRQALDTHSHLAYRLHCMKVVLDGFSSHPKAGTTMIVTSHYEIRDATRSHYAVATDLAIPKTVQIEQCLLRNAPSTFSFQVVVVMIAV